jgi:hypothetical protein
MNFNIRKKQPSSALGPETRTEGINDTKNPAKEADNLALRIEILRWIFTIACAIATYVVIALVVWATYEPDVAALTATAKQILLMPELALPEPMEALLFRLGILTIDPGLAEYYILFSRTRFISSLARSKYFNYVTAASMVLVSAIIFIAFAAHNESEPGKDRLLPVDTYSAGNNNFNFYFDGFFIGRFLWLYAFILVPGIAYLFFAGIKKKNWDDKPQFKKIVESVGYVICGGAVLAIMAMNTFQFPYGNDNKFDFNAVYYSMTQVFSGVPMLVNGFTNTYGLYPHFLNPLFKIAGLSVLNFSFLMSLLLGLAFCLNFYSLRKYVSNKLLLFLGVATMLYFSYLNRKLQNQFDCYYALFPIRYLAPSILVFLTSRFLSKPTIKLYWITTVGMAAAVLWNPEMGLVCYISWAVVNVYRDFYSLAGKINIRAIGRHLAIAIVVLPTVFLSYKGLIYLFYGSIPDMGLLWSTMLVFSKVGFNLLPMALIHPWNVVALIIITGLTFAIAQWHKKAVTPVSSMVLLLSLISLGYVMYFQGRSHSVNLSVSSGFCNLLLTILADELWRAVRKTNVFVLNAAFVVVLFLLSFSAVELVYNADKVVAYVYQEEDKTRQNQEQEFVESNREFILRNTTEGERIQLLTVSKFQGLYFDGNKRKSGFNPGIIDLFLNADLERFQNALADSSLSVFMEPEIFYYPYMQRSVATVSALYEIKKGNKSMVLLNRRKTIIPTRRFFGGEPQVVVHRKYNDDRKGLSMRMEDAAGVKPVKLAPAFSVEVLFYSQPQIFPYAALIGNFDNASGFTISNVSKNNYVFAVGNINNSVQLSVPFNQWVYLVMNVYQDRIEIYQNGKPADSKPLAAPMPPSGEKLSIGNMGFHHNYLGAIAEVAVINKVLDSAQIRQTWEEINAVTSHK